MSDENRKKRGVGASSLAEEVGEVADRKLKAQNNAPKVLSLGLGAMGMIGWTVVVPTLIGAAIGSWLDSHHEGTRSWTLALLMAGLTIGCFAAWYWISNESDAIREDRNA